MKIGIGSDHGGVNHKAAIIKHLSDKGIEVIDYGTQPEVPADYPDVAETVCKGYLKGEFDLGILVCGTGIGMSIAANKVKGIRAAHVTDCYSARMSREHNNAQILCLGERITGIDLALEIVDAYLRAEHQGGRHARRVEKIMNLED
ncbi:MAG: ribose 5-phosphate isomerase B [Clostridia bacterium]|nr:ribose 5-phosphate isomerase B [Clostridia bacterium]MBQ2940968.1 ribose 5-phosphate isomerase B [Clostridia bacterium]